VSKVITQIGIVAGEIWTYLEKHDKSGKLDDIISELGKERDLILMSIGWLAREGHVSLGEESPNYTVKLTNVKERKDE
jgi:hypothetical protein